MTANRIIAGLEAAVRGETGRITIIVPGAPVGKGRPRFVRATGRTYTPKRTEGYEAMVAFGGYQTMTALGLDPFDQPLKVTITAFMPIAKSWSKKVTAAALEGIKRPGRPDADNILKAVADALNGVVWRDDSLLAEVRVSKLYDPQPRLEIIVEPLGAG